MATYLELQTAVQRRVIDLPQAVRDEVPLIINRVIRNLQKAHNFYVMEGTQDYTTVLEQRTLGPLPADFKEFNGEPYSVEALGRLNYMTLAPTERDAIAYFGNDDTGAPHALVRSNPEDAAGAASLSVWPLPDGNSDYDDGEYRVRLPYWKFLPHLVANGETNWFTTNGEDYVIDKSTAEAFAIDWDENRMAIWEKKAAVHRNELMLLDKRMRISPVESFVPHYLGARTPRLRF